MFITIEVAVTDSISNTDRGILLEKLGYEVLESMQYEVNKQVRLTGIEVDLLATHKITSEEIYVECKAQRDNLAADVITKLLGNVAFKGVSAGWLISTSTFGKDGRGLALEWQKKPLEERRKLQLYTPENLAKLLISCGRICAPEALKKTKTLTYSDQVYLLITNYGRFWAAPLTDVNAGVQHSVMLFDASTGDPITEETIVKSVSQTDSSLKELKWLASSIGVLPSASLDLSREIQNIVKVPSSDHWADYRPSRPQDFVGRKQMQSEFFSFLDGVRGNTLKTRIIAIKSPSGWGKSSILLKLESRCQNQHNRNKYHLFAVDCRAAVSRRFGELALAGCFKEAIESGFLSKPKESLQFGGTNNPFADSTFNPILEQLRKEEKVIVLFFDQFEEIFAKQDLAPLFNNINLLCSAIDSAQENIVIGFSWKTDGTIPQDHPAYHMWQGLSDRRREFSLNPFNTTEVSSALTLFSKELEQPLNTRLKRTLTEHCQGYPWLVKKLCIHVFNLVQNGIEQIDILGQALNVGELFKKELEELPSNELACIKKIATDSPAEFYQIEDTYGGDTLTSLFNKRLVLRSGSRLTLYWDIFRDYVLSGKVPHIPVSYIPQSDVQRYCDVLRILLKEGETTISVIGDSLGMGEGRTDNIVRDLVIIGNAEYKRKNGILTALQTSENEAALVILKFWRSHMLFHTLINSKGSGFVTSQKEIKVLLKSLYLSSKFTEKTWDVYLNRITRWLSTIGLVTNDGKNIVHTGDTLIKDLSFVSSKPHRRSSGYFLGAAPPKRALEALEAISHGQTSSIELMAAGYRNAIYVLNDLGLILEEDDKIHLTEHRDGDLTSWLRKKAADSQSVKSVITLLNEKGKVPAKEMGHFLAEQYGFNWSESSKKRYGSALSRWARWSMGQDTQVMLKAE